MGAIAWSAPTWADCVASGRTIQSFQDRQGMVLTFVRGDITRLTVTLARTPSVLLWAGRPFPGLTIRRPTPDTDAVTFTVTPDAPGCALRIERF